MSVMALPSVESIFSMRLFNRHKSGDRRFGGCLSSIKVWLTRVESVVFVCASLACALDGHSSVGSLIADFVRATDFVVSNLSIMSNTEYRP